MIRFRSLMAKGAFVVDCFSLRLPSGIFLQRFVGPELINALKVDGLLLSNLPQLLSEVPLGFFWETLLGFSPDGGSLDA